MKHFEKITGILFQTSSENTEKKPHTDGIFILQNLKKYLEQFDVEIELQQYQKKYEGVSCTHSNFIAKNRVNNGKYIALQGHIDTVPCNKPYEYTVSESEIIGRGSVDMKGPLIGAICAFINIVLKSKQNTILIITDDEETDFAGIERLIKEKDIYLPEIQVCINAEPTNLQPAFFTRGIGQYEISAKGYTAHSSSSKNDFLIEKMASIITATCKFLNETRKISDPIYGDTRAALTMINSGTKTNQLPSDFYLTCNMRLVTKEIIVYKNLFDTIVRPLCENFVEIKELYFEPFESLNKENIAFKLKIAFAKCNIDYKESVMHAFTESYMFNKVNIPCFSWGPGNMDLAHVVPEDERILISDIKLYTKLLILFIENKS